MVQVTKGKLYQMVGHKGLSKSWLDRNGKIWLATQGEWEHDEFGGWVAEFKSVASGQLFILSQYEPWSVELEELGSEGQEG